MSAVEKVLVKPMEKVLAKSGRLVLCKRPAANLMEELTRRVRPRLCATN
jgi:hypothetical protein